MAAGEIKGDLAVTGNITELAVTEVTAVSTDLFLFKDATDGEVKGLDFDNLPGGAGTTNLTWTKATSVVASDTGTDATLTVADSTDPGLMTSANFDKLAAITGTNTGDEVAATTTTAGVVERATQTEVNTGTDTTRYVSPDTLAGAPRSFSIAVFDSDVSCATGNGKLGFCVPAIMANMNIIDATASVHTTGTTGTMDIQIRRRRGATDADVYSTKLTVASAGYTSSNGTVNTANDDLNTGDLIYIDVDAIHTTAAKGLTVTITAQEP